MKVIKRHKHLVEKTISHVDVRYNRRNMVDNTVKNLYGDRRLLDLLLWSFFEMYLNVE